MSFFRYAAGGLLAAAAIVGGAAMANAAGPDRPSGIDHSVSTNEWNQHQDASDPVQQAARDRVQDAKGEFRALAGPRGRGLFATAITPANRGRYISRSHTGMLAIR
jgi:hypothetical protein